MPNNQIVPENSTEKKFKNKDFLIRPRDISYIQDCCDSSNREQLQQFRILD